MYKSVCNCMDKGLDGYSNIISDNIYNNIYISENNLLRNGETGHLNITYYTSALFDIFINECYFQRSLNIISIIKKSEGKQ